MKDEGKIGVREKTRSGEGRNRGALIVFALILKKMYNPGMKHKEIKKSQVYKDLLEKELVYPKSKSSNRASLRGIWKNSEIDESLFDEARRSVFKYESA